MSLTSRGPIGPTANKIDPHGWGFAANYEPMLSIGSTAIAVNNRAAFFRLTNGGIVSKVRLHIIVSAGTISVAAYRNSGSGTSAVPGTRLATSGSVACPAASSTPAEIALDSTVTLYPGDWLAISASDATFAAASTGTNTQGAGGRCAGSSYINNLAHPLPDNPTVAAGFCGPYLLIGVP